MPEHDVNCSFVWANSSKQENEDNEIPCSEQGHGLLNIIDNAQKAPEANFILYLDRLNAGKTTYKPDIKLPKNVNFKSVDSLFTDCHGLMQENKVSGHGQLMKTMREIYDAEMKYGHPAFAGNVVKLLALYKGGMVSDIGVKYKGRTLEDINNFSKGKGLERSDRFVKDGNFVHFHSKGGDSRIIDSMKEMCTHYTTDCSELRTALEQRKPASDSQDDLKFYEDYKKTWENYKTTLDNNKKFDTSKNPLKGKLNFRSRKNTVTPEKFVRDAHEVVKHYKGNEQEFSSIERNAFCVMPQDYAYTIPLENYKNKLFSDDMDHNSYVNNKDFEWVHKMSHKSQGKVPLRPTVSSPTLQIPPTSSEQANDNLNSIPSLQQTASSPSLQIPSSSTDLTLDTGSPSESPPMLSAISTHMSSRGIHIPPSSQKAPNVAFRKLKALEPKSEIKLARLSQLLTHPYKNFDAVQKQIMNCKDDNEITNLHIAEVLKECKTSDGSIQYPKLIKKIENEENNNQSSTKKLDISPLSLGVNEPKPIEILGAEDAGDTNITTSTNSKLEHTGDTPPPPTYSESLPSQFSHHTNTTTTSSNVIEEESPSPTTNTTQKSKETAL